VIVEVEREPPEAVAADLLAVPVSAPPSKALRRLDERLGGRLTRLLESGEAKPEAGKVVLLYLVDGEGFVAPRLALVGIGDADDDSLRTAAAASVRASIGGGTVAWAFDDSLPQGQVRAVVEGAVLGAYDPGRWKTEGSRPRVERLILAGAPDGAAEAAARAALVARWTNRARELVDGPPNEITPAGLAAAAAELLSPLGVGVEAFAPAEFEQLGLGGLAAVGGGSENEPRLIVLRYRGDRQPALGLVGKSITFDSGGYFLKQQSDIVRQKADMGGGAAVVGAVGAIAELGLPLPVLGVLPAAENALGGGAFRPGDVVRTAAGLTVEVTNPDAEGRIVLADGLWYARREGAARLIDVATLTGAMRGAIGDMYIGVFANDDDWREAVVAAGNDSGDLAWPWPLHQRYRRLLDSPLADLRNTSGRSFGYPIVAAAFLERFVDDVPWAHLDIHSAAFLDEERDYLARGASGAGVRLLTELASRLAGAT
jgi:leucyl aminopeptidase